MITRREAMLAAIAALPAAAAAAAVADANGKSVMHSTVFDWEKMDPQATKVARSGR